MEIKVDLVMALIVLIGAAWALMRTFVFKPLNDIANDLKAMNEKMHEIFTNFDKRLSLLEFQVGKGEDK